MVLVLGILGVARAAYVGSASTVSSSTTIQAAATEVLGSGGGSGVFNYKGGGNAVDAAVAAALAACVVNPGNASLGGYGGHMLIWKSGWDGDPSSIRCIDFNSSAGSLATSNMFATNVNATTGHWTGPTPAANEIGWKAVGVPGTFAGLFMAQTNFGRKISGTNLFQFAEILKPALSRVATGQVTNTAYYTLTSVSNLLMDLYTNSPGYTNSSGNPNPRSNNDPYAVFYSGDIATDIVAAMQANGGLVTYADMTNYRPRIVTPYQRHFSCPNGTAATVYVPPPGSSGVSVLQQVAIVEALGWTNGPAGTWDSLHYWHGRAEASRLMWKDHFQWVGDPWAGIKPPDILKNGSTNFCDQLLAHATNGYSLTCPWDSTEIPLTNSIAATISQAVNTETNVPILVHWDDIRYGTRNIATCDQWGNCVAVTFSMGGGFGAQVGMTNRGLVFGQGMALFDPRPGWPNSIAPGKRPLDNMSPAIVVPDFPYSPTNGVAGGRPPFAIGGVGGSTIENRMAMELIKYLADGPSSAVSDPAVWLYNFEANNIIYMPSYPAGVKTNLPTVGLTAPGSPPSSGEVSYVQAWIPPSIITQSTNTTATIGATVSFNVRATGLPLFYHWTKNGLSFSDGGNILGTTTSALTVSNVSSTDAGTYALVITNSASSITSAPITLTVGTNSSPSDIFLYEPFAYTNVGGPVSSNNPANWTYGGSGTNDLNVTSGSLFYPGLALSVGNSVTNGGAGLGVRRLFGTNLSSGKVYFSALFRINDLGFGAWSGAGSIAGALAAPDNTSFRLQVVVKSNSPNGYIIGTAKSGTNSTTTYDLTEHHAGETIFLVGKYDFTVSSNVVSLWINPSPTTFGASNEPAGFIFATNGMDGYTIDRFNMRQNAATGSSSVPASLQWDELRFGFSWAGVTPLDLSSSGPINLSEFSQSTNGVFQFAYTNSGNQSFTVFASTNLINWQSLGSATQVSPGVFQFMDPQVTNFLRRFYRLHSP